MKHYVYMVRAGQFVKVGVAKDPDKRIETLQTGNPYPISILALLPFGSKAQAYSEERRLHKHLAKYHFRGEWFMASCIGKAFQHDIAVEQNKKGNKPCSKARWEKQYNEDDMEILSEALERI